MSETLPPTSQREFAADLASKLKCAFSHGALVEVEGVNYYMVSLDQTSIELAQCGL